MENNEIVEVPVKYVYSQEELRKKGHDMATLVLERDKLEDEKIASNKNLKALIDEKAMQVSILAGQIEAGHEMRTMECYVRLNEPQPGLKTYIVQTTGERVDPPAMMRPEEMQESLL